MSGDREGSGWTVDTLHEYTEKQFENLQSRMHIERRAAPPDPSNQVTRQLDMAITNLRQILTARLDAMDKATELQLDNLSRIPAVISKEIDHVHTLHNERFDSIEKQFAERDVRTEQASTSANQALNAALQAAKELVNAQGQASAAAAVKSETSFTKQIDQIGTIIQTLEKAFDARLSELKERIDRGEGASSESRWATGQTHQATSERFLSNSQLLTVIGLFLVVAGMVVTIVLAGAS